MPDDYAVGSSTPLPDAPTPGDLLSGSHPHQRLSSLRPPPPYSVFVTNLTIIAPVPPVTIPLAVPIPIPGFISRRLGPRSRGADPPRELVRSANLQVEPGEVLAIAGGSGSGKTTLLNAIAGRLGNLDTTGSVSFVRTRCGDNNGPISDLKGSQGVGIGEGKQIRKIVGFVRQVSLKFPCSDAPRGPFADVADRRNAGRLSPPLSHRPGDPHIRCIPTTSEVRIAS